MLAYLERAPLRSPSSLPITAYILEGGEQSFAGYAIEEVDDAESNEAKSVAAVVVVGKKPDVATIVKGLELSAEALAQDEKEREAQKAE